MKTKPQKCYKLSHETTHFQSQLKKKTNNRTKRFMQLLFFNKFGKY